MLISFTKAAWSQTEVAEAAGGRVETGKVGKETEVFVAAGKGRVGVLNGTDWVNCACTVKAAAVKTAFGSWVGVAFDGRLHAATIKMIIISKERLRATLNI